MTAFKKIARPALQPLSERHYEYARWKRATLGHATTWKCTAIITAFRVGLSFFKKKLPG